MDFFGRSNIDKMVADLDYNGLYACLSHRDKITRLRAAQALAELNDGAGWRFLTDAVHTEADPELQEGAAAILGELGARGPADAHRAVPALGEAIKTARGDVALTIRDALEMIGGPDAGEALRRAGYAPSAEDDEVDDYEAHFIRPIMPNTEQFEFLSAEQHLNNAVDLHEAELAERGLVECCMALWLKPDWAYAWYLRGVLIEDLERYYEAWLAYRRAVELDPDQQDASDALFELQNEMDFQPLELNQLLSGLTSRDWRERRDASAGLGELAIADPGAVEPYIDALIALVNDDEREVRYAVIQTLGQIGHHRTILPLLEREESSWLLRFVIIDVLSNLGSVDGLVTVLRKEMNRIQERNPVFSRNKDPLIEVEYDRLMEIGALALERTGDIDRLLAIAEQNSWEEVEGEGEYDKPDGWELPEPITLERSEDFDDQADDDLTSYVDEVAMMVVVALERLAIPRLDELSDSLIRRLANVPDLTLLDLSDGGDNLPEPGVVYDLSGLRKAAQAYITRSAGGSS